MRTHTFDRSGRCCAQRLLDHLFFAQYWSLVRLGYRQPVQQEDCFALPLQERAANATQAFDAALAHLKPIAIDYKWSENWLVVRALWRAFGTLWMSATIWLSLYLCSFACQPLLIRAILRHLEGSPMGVFAGIPPWSLAVFLAVDTALMSLFMQHGWAQNIRCSVSARVVIMNVVLRKALSLSAHGRSTTSVGQLVTLVSVDADRVFYAAVFSVWAYLAPVQIIIVIGLIIREIGVLPSAIAFAMLAVLAATQWCMASCLQKTRIKMTRFTDERVSMIAEILHGIRVIKAYAWGDFAAKRVQRARAAELAHLTRLLLFTAVNYCIMFITPVVVGLVAFVVFAAQGNHLSVSAVFTTFATINLLRLPIKVLPMLAMKFVDAAVALQRFGRILALDEMQIHRNKNTKHKENSARHNDSNYGNDSQKPRLTPGTIDLRSVSFSWSGPNQAPTLSNISLSVQPGELVFVIGRVASGKSSLLSCLLDEMSTITGDLHGYGKNHCMGKISYCSQSSWIQSCSLRDNILFGQAMDPSRYECALDVSQLRADLIKFPGGDLSEIGDRGINLSGGQMARLAVARALYLDGTNTFIYDDILSALDVQVAEALFREAIQSNEKSTRIVSLNAHFHLLPLADRIVVMKGGKIACFGTYDKVKEEEAFLDLVQNFEQIPAKMATRPIPQQVESGEQKCTVLCEKPDRKKKEIEEEEAFQDVPVSIQDVPVSSSNIVRLILDEDRAHGAVSLASYRKYYGAVSSGNGRSLGICVVSLFAIAQIIRTFDDVFLSYWVDSLSAASINQTTLQESGRANGDTMTPTPAAHLWLAMYAGFAILSLLFFLLSSIIFVLCAVQASRTFHNQVLQRLLSASCPAFFDITPLGRVLNRFARDVDQIDQNLPDFGIQLLQNSAFFIAAVVLCAISNVWLLCVLLPLSFCFFWGGHVFRFTIREIKRLEGVSRSPMLSRFAEALNGAMTIRSADAVGRILKTHSQLVDTHNGVFRTMWEIGSWFGIHVDFLGALVVLGVSLFAVANVGDSTAEKSFVGVALTFALQFTSLLQWTVRVLIETENCMTSVERLEFYSTQIPVETKESEMPEDAVNAASWPEKGRIEIRDFCMRYRPNLPAVLSHLNMTIKAGETVGICGRTGAGKSSLISAMLRLCEGHAGGIFIDSISIADLKLNTLRKAISYIPQIPFLFASTVRENLDPFNVYGDDEIWQALLDVGLAQSNERSLLDKKVAEGGSNLSAGTRQLLCVSRALLRKSKIILLDEASANVDTATDKQLQSMLRSHCFRESTVIVVAHRLETIMDADRIAFLEGGELIEFDTPETLMASEDSRFAGLVAQMQMNQRVQMRGK